MTRGFQHVYGNAYVKMFAPVVKFTILRLFFALVAIYDLELNQRDVKTAFQNRDLDVDIYMEQPKSCRSKESPDHDCELQKALFGVKQTPLHWNA